MYNSIGFTSVSLLLFFFFPHAIFFCRILELGFGKDIEEILDLLGSRQQKSIKINAVPSKSEFQRQNLLLSATLNEKVNHLAKMSLENPVMIGLDDKKLQTISLSEGLGSLGSDRDDTEHKLNITGSADGDYNFPSQLVQRYVKGSCLLEFFSG